jgi:uncharacterized protein (DUF1501 family)
MSESRPTPCACDDWRFSRKALIRRGGAALVPIPAEALDGLEAFERSGGLNRRDLLAGGVGLMALCGSLAACGSDTSMRTVLDAAGAANASRPEAPILVSLYLDGGNDGLNTLVPLIDPRYRKLRGNLAISPDDVLPLRDAPEFGWHPALPGLAKLYAKGKVAVLPAVDYANPDLSHFNSAEYWQKGVVGHVPDPTGWLGRALDVIGDTSNPLQGISVQSRLDPALITARAPVASVYKPGDFNFGLDGVASEELTLAVMRDLAAATSDSVGMGAARKAYANAIGVRERLAALPGENGGKRRPRYPTTYLGGALRSLAQMLAAGFGTRVAAVVHDGGFDTHEDQPVHHAQLLGELDDALVAWQADLTRRGLADRVVTLIWSEFGRRPQSNESNGTDHGAGGLLLLVGNRVNGGIRSEFPGLKRLDENDNLRVTTEFRSVYATLLESWLGADPAAVLPGPLPPLLDLIR